MAENERIAITAIARDELSGPVRNMRTEIRALTREIRQANDMQRASAAATDRSKTAANQQREALRRSAAATRAQRAAAMQLRNSLTQLSGSFRTASAAASGFAGTAATRMTQTLAVAGVAATTFGLRAASGFEQAHVAFNTMLGEVQGERLFAQLQAFNIKSPFEFSDVNRVAQTLMAYGVQAEQMMPMVEAIANISAGTNRGVTGLASLSLAIGQVSSRGKVMGTELRQMAEAGVNGYRILASISGKTEMEVMEMMERGEHMEAGPFLQAITQMTGGLERFQGVAEAQSQTLWGLWSTFKDITNIELGETFAPLQKTLVTLLPAAMPMWREFLEDVGVPLNDLFGTLLRSAVVLLPVMGPLVGTIFQGLADFLRDMAPSAVTLTDAAPLLTDAMVDFGEALLPLAPALGELLMTTGPLTLQLLVLGTQLATVVIPPLVEFLEWITRLNNESGAARFVTLGLIGALLGFRAISGVFGTISALTSLIWSLNAAQSAGALSAGRLAIATRGLAMGGAVGLIGAGGIAGTAVLSQNAQGERGFWESVLGSAGVGATAGGIGGAFIGGIGAVPGAVIGGGVGAAVGAGSYFLGDPPGSLARTAALHSEVESATPGSRRITSSMRDFALASPASSHPAGRALDMTGPFLQTYARNLRRAGGWAAIHDAGTGRHLHGEYGDVRAPARAASGRVDYGAFQINFNGPIQADIDVERAVRRAIADHERERRERA